MGRSGYVDWDDWDEDSQWAIIRQRGALLKAIKGKRGQVFLKDLLAALDAMPTKRLITQDLQSRNGEVCTLGCLGVVREFDMENTDPEEHETLARMFNIAKILVREIEWENDDAWLDTETPETRWKRMRAWVEKRILEGAAA